MEEAAAGHRPLETEAAKLETASRRQSTATGVRGPAGREGDIRHHAGRRILFLFLMDKLMDLVKVKVMDALHARSSLYGIRVSERTPHNGS
jgi:hypothetical protein